MVNTEQREKSETKPGSPPPTWESPAVEAGHQGIQDLCGRKISCRAKRAGALKGGNCVTEYTMGICALVNSSYITVNLIKYTVIPIEGILISWVRNKLFSLLLQMKTSLLFCGEGVSLAV